MRIKLRNQSILGSLFQETVNIHAYRLFILKESQSMGIGLCLKNRREFGNGAC